MPHTISNRPKSANPVASPLEIRQQFLWESLNAGVYTLGGITFIAGSAMFFPAFSAWLNLGCMLFLIGSILYLVVTLHDVVEATVFWRRSRLCPAKVLELTAAWLYVLGTLLFVVGSLLFTSWFELKRPGAWCFIVGSLCFVAGATINIMQIIRQTSLVSLVMTNLTAVSFVTGSVLFTVASIPYLWHYFAPHDHFVELNFLACQYLVGSGLFLMGGVLNLVRSWMLMRWRLACLADDPDHDKRFLALLRGELT